MSFEDDLKAQYEAPRKTADFDINLNGHVYTLRFERMDGDKWAAEADLHPPRPGVPIDKYGYNIRSLCRSVAQLTGGRVDGDEVVPLTAAQWDAVFKSPGSVVEGLCDAIWVLNSYGPTQELDALKKGRSVSGTN